MKTSFSGFTPGLFKFLRDLKINNNKEWFLANKSKYETEIKNKTKEFVDVMAIIFSSLNLPYISNIKSSLFRIHRDIRFSKNKNPYKTNVGIFFPYQYETSKKGKLVELPGLYIHFEPNDCFLAGGLHSPTSEQLKRIRENISINYEDFNGIINSSGFIKEFDSFLQDSKLKRVPAGYPKDHPAAEMLKLKSFTVYNAVPQKLAYSEDLINIVAKKAKVIEPFLQFLSD